MGESAFDPAVALIGLRGSRSGPPPSSSVRTNRQCAVLRLHKAGLRVLEDLAVFAFDGSPESEYTWPRLSTVAGPVKDLGQTALEALLAGSETQTKIFPSELVLRTSCGCH
ncbi:substrate-binding domain-containing protein [Arthrobacter sp. alpha11c]